MERDESDLTTRRHGSSAGAEDLDTRREAMPSGEAPAPDVDTVAERLRQELELGEGSERRYCRLDEIGHGGMGEVTRAYDARLGHDVALKTMLPLDPRAHSVASARFLREARIQALLEHPSVVPVYDIGIATGGLPYFAMKRIRGETLHEVLREARASGREDTKLGLRRVLVKLVTVCQAVHYAHERGVIHRDLKPDNVMLGPHGEVYVLDWGVAKIVKPGDTEAAESDLDASTKPGEMVGTAGYMPPEQVLGHHEQVDARSDVYALGAILYEVLTLRRLHPGSDAVAVLESTLNPSRRPPEQPPANVPPELFDLARQCTAFHKLDRPASARAIAEAVERYLDGDRDAALRAKLADERAARAQAALAGALSGPSTEREAARGTAMREAGRALALAPEHRGATDVVVQLLTTPPETVPAEAAREIAELERAHREAAVRDNALRIVSWAVAVPMPILMGVREPALVATILGLFAACALAGVLLWRTGTTSGRARMGLYVLTCLFAASAASVFGPLVLVPGFAAMNTLIFSAQASPRERPAMIALGIAVICLPLLGELLGLLPPSMRFEPDAIVLLPRLTGFHPAMSLLFLVTVSVLGILTPTLLTGRLREALREAERKIVVQNWQLAHLSRPG